MGEEIPASLTLYIPQGGLPKGLKKFGRDLAVHLELPPEGFKILTEGGRLVIEDGQASYGWPRELNWESPEESSVVIPKGVDWDYHSDGKYEYNARIAFQRAGRIQQYTSDQNGTILLDEQDVERIVAAGGGIKEILAAFKEPPASYPVPEAVFEIPY